MVKSFYADRGLNAETYDARTLGFPGEIDFWVARALASGGPVLELACGTGRVSWPIARAGIEVVGLDLAPAMIERAESKPDTERPDVGARVTFVLGNMADFTLSERFALAIIPFRAFQMLLGIEEQRRSLCGIHAHLRPGGRLIVDIFDPRLDLLGRRSALCPSNRLRTTGIHSRDIR
jgi:SAM-dependent methyltransferase